MALDAAISKLSAHNVLDGRGTEILAAATRLRDLRERVLCGAWGVERREKTDVSCSKDVWKERANAVRVMCGAWGVNRREKIDGKWKDRSLDSLQALLSDAVLLAAAQWQADESIEPSEKKPRLGAAEHDGRAAAAAAIEQEEPGRDAVASELFRHDHALVKWLRAHVHEPRCRSLLQQIHEWRSHNNMAAKRKLAVAQGITVPRKSRSTSVLFLEAVRKHFQEAISLEKSRLAMIDMAARGKKASGVSDHAAH